jgi:hypothetical protein
MKVDELKNLCRRHDLALGGNKKALMSRLVKVVAAAAGSGAGGRG